MRRNGLQAMMGKDARHAEKEVHTTCSLYLEVDEMFVHLLLPRRASGKRFYVTKGPYCMTKRPLVPYCMSKGLWNSF